MLIVPGRPARPVGRRHVSRRLGPSAVQVLLFCAYTAWLSIMRPEKVPALPMEARTLHGWALASKILWGIVPSLVLIFLVLGTLPSRSRHPDRGRRHGAVGALALAALHRRLTWDLLPAGDVDDDADHLDGGLHPGRVDASSP